jgi:hypothetical protein
MREIVCMLLNAYFQRSATIAWNTVHTLLHLLGITNRSGFHQCPPSNVCLVLKRVLTLKRLPKSQSFPQTRVTYAGNDSVITCSIWRMTVASIWLNWMDAIWWVSFKLQTVFCILNFPVETLLIPVTSWVPSGVQRQTLIKVDWVGFWGRRQEFNLRNVAWNTY